MRVLVATDQMQGDHEGDFAFTVEGELVLVEVAECDTPERCGCGRSWPGIASRRATTTAMVVDLPHVSEHDLRQAVTDWFDASGWTSTVRSAAEVEPGFTDCFDDVEDLLDAMVDEHVELIEEVCAAFPVGTVLERTGTQIRARTWPVAA